MDCSQAKNTIAAAVDGELDLPSQLELERHLAGCAGCRADFEAARARRGALRERLPVFAAPAALRESLAARFHAPAPAPILRPAFGWPAWASAALAAGVTLAMVGSYQLGVRQATGTRLLSEAVSIHVRSLQEHHLTDVLSTDQHTVKPWFAGKLDFSPPVTDLASQGFPLFGGRLEYVAGAPAAALIYRRHQHTINLLVWRAGATPLTAATQASVGFHTVSWSQAGLNFVAISEIPAAELESFAAAYRDQTK